MNCNVTAHSVERQQQQRDRHRAEPPFPPRNRAQAAEDQGEITCWLRAWRSGESEAVYGLVPKVYSELRRLAQHMLRSEVAIDLEATGLVHELFLRLTRRERPRWNDRRHFFAVAALIMRRHLIDRARRARSCRHGGDAVHVELSANLPDRPRRGDLEALDEALQELARLHPRRARIVDLKFFFGFTLDEVAAALSISQATVVREWRVARAWLYRELGHGLAA